MTAPALPTYAEEACCTGSTTIRIEPRTPLPRALTGAFLALLVAITLARYGEMPARRLTPDTIDTLQYAACLEQRLSGASSAPCAGAHHWSPGLPVTMACLHRAGLDPLATARLLALIAAALLPLPVFALAAAIGGTAAGLAAATLVATYPIFRIYALIPDARLPALLLTFAAYAASATWLRTGARRWAWLAGAAAGAVTMWRPEGKLVLALVLGVSVLRAATARAPAVSWTRRLSPTVAMASGAFLISSPLLIVQTIAGGGTSLEPRGWETVVVGWIPYIPTWVFIPLFDIGAQPTPLRTLFQQQLETGALSVPLTTRVMILATQLAGNLGSVPGFIAQTVTLELLVPALLGVVTLARRPGGRRPLALWLLILSPLVPLSALVHTFNSVLPEANLLFVPVALCVVAGVGLAAVGGTIGRRFPAAVPVVSILLLAAWVLRGHRVYAERLEDRVLFESSSAVHRAALWTRAHSTPETAIYSSYTGAAVPVLAGRTRMPWPSNWEIPAMLARSRHAVAGSTTASPLIVVTPVDLVERPLEVREWLQAEPPLEMLHLEDGPEPGMWVAILSPSTSGDARVDPTP